jgi:glutamine amidotransferase
MTKVTIIDYGSGNIFSVNQAFKKIGSETIITSNPKMVENAKFLVLPGVGAFHKGMEALHNLDLYNSIIKTVKKGVPLIGICLGMQMLLDESDEFKVTKGLGLIPGRVEKFPSVNNKNMDLKVPQVNWQQISPNPSSKNWKHTLLKDHKFLDEFYFVHSFIAKPTNAEEVLAHYYYNELRVTAVVLKDNIVGCQFHPEKSGDAGLKLLKNFTSL